MSSPLSWLMIATHVPPSGTGGGIVRYTVELAIALAARTDVELSVVANSASHSFFTKILGDPARVAVSPPLPTVVRSILEREGCGIAAFRKEFDIIHGTKHFVPRRGRGRMVLTVHDMLPLDMPDEFNVLKRTFLRRPYLGSIEQADTLLCVSEATRDRMTEYVPMARERSMVVPLAASSSLLGATAEPVPELVQREFAFVVGDPSRRKNIALLVDLWPDVVRRRPGAVLAIVGPPSWGPSSLGRFHGQLTEQGQIASLGYVNDAELRWCYEHATVVLCPSRAEGFGLPAVEALAFGAPLITSDDAALCEVSGNAALHLPASDRRQWLEAIVTALMAGRVTNVAASVRPRAWKDVAAETVAAVRHPA